MNLYLSNYEHLNAFTTDTVKAALLNNYEFSATDRYLIDVSEFEITDPSYSRIELTGKSRIVSGSTITFSASTMSFGAANVDTVSGVILYKEVTGDLDSLLLAYWDLPVTTLDGTGFEITIPASGLVVVNA